MPFKRGIMPERRTLEFLNQGKIYLRKQVKILALGVNFTIPRNEGARDFLFWDWAQLQFKNPDVQMMKFRDFTPLPFLLAFLEDGREVTMDLDGLSRQEIHDRVLETFGKTAKVMERERMMAEKQKNPANMGMGYDRQCMCEVPGQHPCTFLFPAPKYMKGSWRWNKNLV